MGNALQQQTIAPAGALVELTVDEFMDVARNSLYPGALDASIKLVWNYCQAARLDPMQKPVHIVGMSVKKPGTRDEYEWRDVILPGINLYRVQAARSEQHLGTSEPEFGPPVTRTFGRGDAAVEVTFPEWCKVTVRRLKAGHIAEYTAKELWIENYASAGKNTDVPNSMWRKRSYGQLAKCAEAQALRKAFPETSRGETAEEMEGKVIEGDFAVEPRPAIQMPQPKREPTTIDQATGEIKTAEVTTDTKAEAETKPSKSKPATDDSEAAATEGQKRLLRAKLTAACLGDTELQTKFGFSFEQIATKGQVALVQAWIQDPAG
jgi:phage recombination protein Bet